MWYKQLTKNIEGFISALTLILYAPEKLVKERIIARIPNILLGMLTVLLFSISKYQVVSGIIMFKTLKMLVTMFPQYSFLTYYAGYVNTWGVFLGVLIDLLLLSAFTLFFYSGIRLLGIKHKLVCSLTIICYSWVMDSIIIVAGFIALPLDIISSALILIIATLVSFLLKAYIIMRAYVTIFNIKWTSVFAIFLVSIIVLGLILIGVMVV